MAIGAVDIGGAKIARARVVDSQGRIRRSKKAEREYAKCVQQTRMPRGRRAAHIRLDGMGVGCTGPVFPIPGGIRDVNLSPQRAGTDQTRLMIVYLFSA